MSPTPSDPRRPRLRRALPVALAALAAAAVVTGPALGAAPRLTGPTLFRGDWDTGDTSQWGWCQTQHTGGIRVTAGPGRPGTRVGRFEVTDRDYDGFGDRSECQASTGEAEGQTRLYSWSTLLPANLPAANARAWAVITQWHCTCPGSPPVGLYLQDGQLQLSIHRRNGQSDNGQIELVPWGRPLGQVLGRWTQFTMKVRWSARDRQGFVELWVNGAPQRMNWPRGDTRAARYGGVGATRVRVRTLVPGSSGAYLKQGLYRSGSIGGTAVVFHDGMRMSGVG